MRSLTLLAAVVGQVAGPSTCGTNGTTPLTVTTNFATETPLTSDDIGKIPAAHMDPKLVDAWGLASATGTAWIVANHGSRFVTAYDATGLPQPIAVSTVGEPTGIVVNDSPGFLVIPPNQAGGAAATFIVATSDGTIEAWNPNVPGTQTIVMVDDSSNGAVFKGLALIDNRLYATDFHGGTVETFGPNWLSRPTSGGFADPSLPAGYAPFGIRAIANQIYVTFALRDPAMRDDVEGLGHGFVDLFTIDGVLIRRIATQGNLDSPWGLALAPADFAPFPNMLLVGNFGDGHVQAFDLLGSCDPECVNVGELLRPDLTPLIIDGLWGLGFGLGDALTGPANQLFFTAGPNHQLDGVFGTVTITH
jgi:uncharacterized protein (TIGR03118 family)